MVQGKVRDYGSTVTLLASMHMFFHKVLTMFQCFSFLSVLDQIRLLLVTDCKGKLCDQSKSDVNKPLIVTAAAELKPRKGERSGVAPSRR